MSPRPKTVAGVGATLLASLLLASGCVLLAGKSDYNEYRQIRVAEDEHERLVAMARYVTAHPGGAWAGEVQAYRAERENGTYESNKSTLEGLRYYLAAYPDGQFVAEAQPRLAALEAVQGRRNQEAANAEEVERHRREALEEQRRTWVTRASQFWTGTLLGISNWGSPIAQVARRNEAFSQAFGQDPRPRCSREECIKFYGSHFGVPIPGSTRLERDMRMLLRLRLDHGRVNRVEILMPEKGFSRWFELENRTPVIDEDPEARQQAIDWALERLLPVIRQAMPGAQSEDVVPEPIDPPTVRAPNQPDPGADRAPGDVVEEEPAAPAEGQTPAPGPAEQPGQPAQPAAAGSLDALLDQAAGVDSTQQAVAPTPEPEPEPVAEPEAIVLPIALQGFRAGNLRVVLFAAASEDYGAAYDGLFIELVQ